MEILSAETARVGKEGVGVGVGSVASALPESKFRNRACRAAPPRIIRGPNWQDYSSEDWATSSRLPGLRGCNARRELRRAQIQVLSGIRSTYRRREGIRRDWRIFHEDSESSRNRARTIRKHSDRGESRHLPLTRFLSRLIEHLQPQPDRPSRLALANKRRGWNEAGTRPERDKEEIECVESGVATISVILSRSSLRFSGGSGANKRPGT